MADRSTTGRRSPRRVIQAIQASVPGLRIGVRLSAFDSVPYRRDAEGVGVPEIGAIDPDSQASA